MKQITLLLLMTLCSFRDEKKATLTVTRDQYTAIRSNLADAIRSLDSIKVVMHFKGTETDATAARAQSDIIEIYNYFGIIDSVWNPKK